MRRKWKWKGKGRCGHNHCTDCATRRGNKRGIRSARYAAKQAARREKKENDTP